jgi:hypothetical protein
MTFETESRLLRIEALCFVRCYNQFDYFCFVRPMGDNSLHAIMSDPYGLESLIRPTASGITVPSCGAHNVDAVGID